MKKVNDYFSNKNYNLEKEELFEKFYHFGCHVSELRNDNDYIKLEIFDNDLISTFLWKFSVGLKISLFYGKTTINFNVLFQNN